ncbi:unnamed protein product [Ostreobium quekettii]|uniref:Methyltransferase domain-containing protein n=1 Tax=Ostreobium quekettii TaxID=121088 RepID=A0A8S1ISA3_9CHLO|nr:unnamed protein product [Ostreobium quekettii]
MHHLKEEEIGAPGGPGAPQKHASCELRSETMMGQQNRLPCRWVREWLFQQASARLLTADADGRHFWMTPVQADAMANETGPDASPAFLAGVAQQMVGISSGVHKLKDSFRTGLGLRYDDYGAAQDLALGVSRELSVWVRHCMVEDFCTIPGLKDLLERGAPVADVACGCGEGLLTLARAFPASTFTGYDNSDHALAAARRRQEELGVTNATFVNPDTEAPMPSEGTFDFVYTMDAIHDMPRPDAVIGAVRQAVKDGGRYLIGDFQGRDSPGANISEMPEAAALFYGYSTLLCMSSAMSQEGAMGLGTLGLTEVGSAALASTRLARQDPFLFPHTLKPKTTDPLSGVGLASGRRDPHGKDRGANAFPGWNTP